VTFSEALQLFSRYLQFLRFHGKAPSYQPTFFTCLVFPYLSTRPHSSPFAGCLEHPSTNKMKVRLLLLYLLVRKMQSSLADTLELLTIFIYGKLIKLVTEGH
jgi:hypothetical protein